MEWNHSKMKHVYSRVMNAQIIHNTFVLAAYVDAHKRKKVESRANLWHALTTDIREITVF